MGMTPREELIDKVAQALEEAHDRTRGTFDSVKLAEIAADVVLQQVAASIREAFNQVPTMQEDPAV
jgi:hypothetical protein